MKKEVTQSELERRMEAILSRPAEEMTEAERASLAAAEAMDDGTSVSLEDFAKNLEDYSGRLVLRIPRSLHKSLKEQAAIEGVSLNQYMLYKLSL